MARHTLTHREARDMEDKETGKGALKYNMTRIVEKDRYLDME